MNDKFEIVYEPMVDLIKKSIELDKLVFQDECDICDIDTCMEWTRKNDKLYTFLLANGELIGYTNLMPVTNEFYDKFKSGKLKDSSISKDDIVVYEKNKTYKCLFVSIVVSPKFQNTLALKYLFQGFVNKMKILKNEGIHISNILMDCVSVMGRKCAIKMLNGKFITNSSNGEIFEGDLRNL